MTKPETYGKFYWRIATDLVEDGWLYIHADEVKVEGGALIAIGGRGETKAPMLILPAGRWAMIHSASVFDGSALCIDHLDDVSWVWPRPRQVAGSKVA